MRVRLLGAALACAVIVGVTAASAAGPSFTFPTRLGFQKGDDWEPSIAADRYGHVYALWSHYVGYGGLDTGEPDPSCADCGSPHSVLQISNNGGVTWSAPHAIRPTLTRQDDPQIVVDPADGRTVYAAFMENNKSSEFVARSEDFGQTWKTMLVEPLQRGTDKDILAARGGHVYLVYHTQQKIWASFSHDSGQTWSTNDMVGSTSQFGVSYASGGAIDTKGNAFFAWNGVTQAGKAKGPVNLYVTKSTDGGSTWTTSLVDTSQAPKDCGCGGYAFWSPQMALGIDARDRVYVLYGANRVKFDVTRQYFSQSVDGGDSWSVPKDISLAPTGSNNAFPALAARGDGDVRIAWMDDRNGFDTGFDDPNGRWNVYYRSSTDGGATWSAEAKLSQFVAGYPYKYATPADGFGEPYGDYFELDIDGAGKTHVLWGEGPSYAGPGNVWYARQR